MKSGYFWTIGFNPEDGLYAITEGMVDERGVHLGEAARVVGFKDFEEALAALRLSNLALQAFLRDMKEVK